MRIALISDTHISRPDDDIPASVYAHFTGVDLIIHTGDIYISEVLDRLERIAPLVVVKGNGDDDRSFCDPRLLDSHVLTLAGLRVGLRHSIVFPECPPTWTLESEMKRCFGGPVDVIVVGDTHVAQVVEHKGVLVINPGSPTWPNNLRRQLGTVAILEIADGRPSARIIQLT